jgi:CxxC motif-containing protein (DUF1111 family)
MGSTLADGVRQGKASASEFRTAPLWGVGQRIFLLHDERPADLLQAIKAHETNCSLHQSNCSESEANGVVDNFNGLSASQKQDILNFIRSP